MIKLTFCLMRLPGLTREEFQDYWHEKHAPLVAGVKDAMRMRRYVQTHSFDPAVSAVLKAARHGPDQFDGVAELWWDSFDDIKALADSAEAHAAGKLMLEDERKFIDLSRSPQWWGRERVIFG